MTPRRQGAWHERRIDVDLDRLPAGVDLSPPRLAAAIALGFGGLWLAGSLELVAGAIAAPAPAVAFTLLFPAIGLAIVGASLAALLSRRRATFDAAGVTVEGRSLRGRERWRAAYDEFAGVGLREHTVRRRNGATTFQIIELVHPDPARTVPLHVAPALTAPRERWEAYARALELPALEISDQGVTRRAVEELDKSLQDLAREGRLATGYDPDRPPPPGLRVLAEGTGEEARLRVLITAPRMPWWLALMFAAIPVAIVAAAVAEGEPWPMAAVGVAMLAIVAWMLWYDRRFPRELVLSRHEIAFRDPWVRTAGVTSLPLGAVESVRIARARSNLGAELVIASDQGRIASGPGLSRAALQWLADFVAAAIATA